MVHHRGAPMVLHLLRLEVAAMEDAGAAAAAGEQPTPAPDVVATARGRHFTRSQPPSCRSPSPCRRCPRRRRRQACHRRTHHGRATIAPIRAIHHDGNDEHIPDLLRPQADIDHSGHTRRVFLARHQQIQLHPAPIVAHFKSEPYHRLIWIFMAHSTDFDPRMDHHEGSPKPHLAIDSLRPSSATINHKPTVQPASHEHGNDPTSQHAATVAARACHRRCPRPPRPLPVACCLRRLITTVHPNTIERFGSFDLMLAAH
ncbi:hypothetical protein ACLOJK_037634 [Asimina triloba]